MAKRPIAWMREPQTWLALGLAVLYLVLAIPSARRAGIVTDEVYYMKAAKVYGYYAFEAVTSLAPFDPDLLYIWSYNREHPPLAKVLASIPWGLTLVLRGGDMPFELSVFAHRVGPLILSAASVVVLSRWLAHTHGPAAGTAAGLALIGMPRWFAHSRYAALDGPMAAMWLLTVAACWKGLRDRRWAIAAGVVFGLALATKLNAFFIPFGLGLWALLAHHELLLDRWRELTEGRWRQALGSPPGRMLIAGALLAPLVFFATWPWLWTDTIAHLAGYVDKHLTHTHILTHYLGTTYRTAPWHYPLVMTAATVPLTILGLTGVGLTRTWREADPRRRSMAILLTANAAVPVAVLMLGTPKYDGVRLFLPTFPFLAGLAGIGFATLLDGAHRRLRETRVSVPALAGAGLVLVAAPGAHAYATMDPYEDSYYNAAMGGPSGALAAGMEIEVWGQSDRDLVPWLNEQANAADPLSVYMPAGQLPFRYYELGDIGYVTSDLKAQYGMPDWVAEQDPLLEDNVTFVDDRTQADVVVLMSRPGMFTPADWQLYEEEEPAHAVTVRGAPLTQVYDVRSQ
jgi:4-amino-4-deoxy-L-arabinose transferase-like glycosyltransferase